MGFNLQQAVPWGRSFDEYCAMFQLSAANLRRSILGAGDGPAAFNAVLSAKGGRIISADPIYAFSAEQISARIDAIFVDMVEQVAANADHLRLDKFGSAAALGQVRRQAMEVFLQDLEPGKAQGRYLAAELPVLPFAAQQFDLALCSHLLFLYSTQLGLEFHLQAISELCRVAREVRIFPLLDLDHRPSAHLRHVLAALSQAGCKTSIETVDYEFQTGANQMLRIEAEAAI